MPVITAITAQTNNKNRCNLFADGEFYAGISVESAMKNRLKVGMVMTEAALKQLTIEDDRAEALAKAVSYISGSLKTVKQVKSYLLKKGYSEETAKYCLEKLKDYDYLDDREYARRYAESVAKKQGRRMTEYKLMMKGVRKEVIDAALEDVGENGKANAAALAVKYMKNKERTKENAAKAFRYLIGKGFTYEEASEAVSSLTEED